MSDNTVRTAAARRGQGGQKTIDAFVEALNAAVSCADVRWDEFARAPVRLNPVTMKTEPLSDADLAAIQAEVETRFGLYSTRKFDFAFRLLCADPARAFHPIKRRVEAIMWDGRPHITRLLERVMKTEPSPLAAEAARLLFAGGIHRLYEPGCKFDYLVTLIGTKQGEGKSTFLRWLAIEDDWFGELKTFDCQKGAEALSGKWIVEVPEMAALRRSEMEEVKAFITQQRDHYRLPYDRSVSDVKRRCILAGTTNSRQFLTDTTGNRRFLPVEVFSSGYDLYRNEGAVRAEIGQCWAEAYALRDEAFMRPVPDGEAARFLEKAQRSAEVEDPDLESVRAFLEDRDATCVREIFYDALGHSSYDLPKRSDSNHIVMLLQKAGWKRNDSAMYPYSRPKPSRQAKWVRADNDGRERDAPDVSAANGAGV